MFVCVNVCVRQLNLYFNYEIKNYDPVTTALLCVDRSTAMTSGIRSSLLMADVISSIIKIDIEEKLVVAMELTCACAIVHC